MEYLPGFQRCFGFAAWIKSVLQVQEIHPKIMPKKPGMPVSCKETALLGVLV